MVRWDDYVLSHQAGTPFHLSAWIRTIHETYSFQPELSVSCDKSGGINGVLPYFKINSLLSRPRIVSLPFSDYCSPLTFSIDIERELLKETLKKNAGASSIEVRGPLADPSGYRYHEHYSRYILRLDPDPMKTYKKFNKKTTVRCIKKAEKAGIKIIEDNSPNGVEIFYKLNKLTRKKHGVPCQSKFFFECITKNIISKGLGFILLAFYESEAISGALFFKFNKSIYYKYNASDPAYLVSKAPNHLLLWHLIQKATGDGYDMVDLGRTAKENLGLTRYKKMWGAEALELPYYFYPSVKGVASNKESGLSYRIATGIWKHMPNTIIDRLGPILMKRLA